MARTTNLQSNLNHSELTGQLMGTQAAGAKALIPSCVATDLDKATTESAGPSTSVPGFVFGEDTGKEAGVVLRISC